MKQSVVHREITKNKIKNKIENLFRSMWKTNAQRKFLLSKRPNVVTEFWQNYFFCPPLELTFLWPSKKSIVLLWKSIDHSFFVGYPFLSVCLPLTHNPNKIEYWLMTKLDCFIKKYTCYAKPRDKTTLLNPSFCKWFLNYFYGYSNPRLTRNVNRWNQSKR